MFTKLSIRPQMKTSAQLVITSRLLQISASELEQLINQELISNPALVLAKRREFTKEDQTVQAPGNQTTSHLKTSIVTGAGSHHSFEETVENMAHRPSPLEQLIEQASMLLNKSDLEIAVHLIHHLDHRGYLVHSTAQLASEIGVPEETIERVVRILRQMEPPGIGARDIQDCFLIQCDHLEAEGMDCQPVRHILTLAWADFLNQRWDRVAKKVQASKEEVENACNFMRLNFSPYPLAMLETSTRTTDILNYPDLIVLQENRNGVTEYSLEIPGERDFELRISASFKNILVDHKPGQNELPSQEAIWIKIHSEQAWMVIGALRQRWKTLRQIGEYLIVHQREFLEHGVLHLKPVTRAAVSRELNLHESTISRAVNDKIIQLPNGHLIPLANLFDPSLAGKEAVRKVLENSPNTLSDQKVAELLQGQGMNLSRRTITKYRHELNLCSSRRQTAIRQRAD